MVRAYGCWQEVDSSAHHQRERDEVAGGQRAVGVVLVAHVEWHAGHKLLRRVSGHKLAAVVFFPLLLWEARVIPAC